MAPKDTSTATTALSKSAGKRKAPAVGQSSSVSGSKKQKEEGAAPRPSPKSILKKAPTANVKEVASPSTPIIKKATVAPSPPSSASRKGKGKATLPSKSPLTSTEPIRDLAPEDEDQDADSIASADEAEMLKGLSSDDDDDDAADSSDEEEDQEKDDDSSDEDDSTALKRHASILTSSLPSSKDDAAVKQRLDRLSKQRQSQPASKPINTAVLYVGHLPKHFTEQPLRQYFSQFGTIARLRLSRNKKSGASKHYGFIEFADEEVGRIVQETMDNYLILGQLLKVKILHKDEIHPKLWIGANRTFRKVPGDRRARVQHDGPKTSEQKAKVEAGLLSRQEKKRQALKEAGIDYQFEGYKTGPLVT